MGLRSVAAAWHRRRALGRRPAPPLEAFLRTPPPGRRTPLDRLELVAVDLETTGLDTGRDSILSIGRVQVRGARIVLAAAHHHLIRVDTEIPEASAVIHRITDDHAATGERLDEALPPLLEALAGRVMLAHHAAIERGFLAAACRRLYGAPLVVPVVDTERLARRRLERRHQDHKAGDLRLFNLRERYGLPRYQAHNALSDALATAELFLAISADMAPKGGLRLADVVTG